MEFKMVLPSRIIFGKGELSKAGEEAERLGATRPLIVTSRGMQKRECLGQLLDSISNAKVYSNVGPDPSTDDVDMCLDYVENGYDLIIGLGGGSVMDVAKKVATNLNLPKMMIPTIAGSGSEVTHDVVIKVDGKKQGVADDGFVADVAIIDSDLTKTLPLSQLVTASLDAVAHAIESLEAERGNPLTRTLAWEACRLFKDGIETGDELSLMSLLAGMAFGNSGTTLGHALSYPLSSRGMSHSEAVAVMLPYAVEFNGSQGGCDARLQNKIREMVLDMGGIEIDCADWDKEEMSREVMQDTRHLSNNPKEVKYVDIVDIYERMMDDA